MLSRGQEGWGGEGVYVCFDSEWRLWEGYFCKTKPCISLKYNDFNFSYKISSKFCLITS